MALKLSSSRRSKARPYTLHKPREVVHPRVQAVGPEHFAFACFDCAKSRSKMMLADFYGDVIIEPTTVSHNRFHLDAAIQSVRDAMADHDLKEVIVVVERTGRYHRVVQSAFRKAGFEAGVWVKRLQHVGIDSRIDRVIPARDRGCAYLFIHAKFWKKL
jgi:hypothetical protein